MTAEANHVDKMAGKEMIFFYLGPIYNIKHRTRLFVMFKIEVQISTKISHVSMSKTFLVKRKWSFCIRYFQKKQIKKNKLHSKPNVAGF